MVEYNKKRNFKEDLDNSNNPILRKSWEKLLLHKFGSDAEIIWKDEIDLQKGFGIDVIVKTSKGRRYSIELKTRKNSCYNDPFWIMEIVSHVYDHEEQPRTYLHSKEGWIYSTTAEYVFHSTLDKTGTELIEAIFYSLSPFKHEKYKKEFEQYKNMWLATVFNNGNFQLTLNKLIPSEIIKKDAIEFWEWKR